MTFLAPSRLWLLLAVGAAAVAYLVLEVRRRRDAARFAAPALLPLVAPSRPGWRRHLAAGLRTIAFGTNQGAVVVDGEVVPVPADRDAMVAVADITGGTASEAETADQLHDVYDDIGARVGSVVEQREVGRAFLGTALVALLAAMAGSFVWAARLP